MVKKQIFDDTNREWDEDIAMTGVGTMTKAVSNAGLDLAFMRVLGFQLDLMAMKPASPQMVYNDAAMYECYKKRGFVEDQSSLWFDAISRDFTVNSLYYNLQTGEIEDPIGMGMPDIKEGVVCTSHPYLTNQNFENHEVRILRALRFTE